MLPSPALHHTLQQEGLKGSCRVGNAMTCGGVLSPPIPRLPWPRGSGPGDWAVGSPLGSPPVQPGHGLQR